MICVCVCVPLRNGNLWLLGVKKLVKDDGKIEMFAQLALQYSDEIRKSRIFSSPLPPPPTDINLS